MNRVITCVKCGAVLNAATCALCGADNTFTIKVKKTADALYNLGLSLSRQGRFTEASDALKRSVRTDKTNILARNLLGLSFYAIGRVGDAERAWKIARKLDPNDALSAYYLERLEADPQTTERMYGAINMYNNALKYLEQGSEDMAIIQLRKAVDQSPRFLAALDLLTACFINMGDMRRASGICDRALAVDQSDAIALSYFTIIHSDKQITSQPKQRQIRPSESFALFGLGSLLSRIVAGAMFFVAGAIIAALIVTFFISNPAISARDASIATIESDAKTEQQRLSEQATALTTQLADKKAENEKLTLERDQANANADQQSRILGIYKASEKLAADDALTAIDMLRGMSPDGLPAEANELYHSVYSQSMSKMERTLYNDGVALHKSGKSSYPEAAEKFKESLQYASEESEVIGSCYYYLGVIAENDQNTNDAKQYFENAIAAENSISDKNMKDAKKRLENLTRES